MLGPGEVVHTMAMRSKPKLVSFDRPRDGVNGCACIWHGRGCDTSQPSGDSSEPGRGGVGLRGVRVGLVAQCRLLAGGRPGRVRPKGHLGRLLQLAWLARGVSQDSHTRLGPGSGLTRARVG